VAPFVFAVALLRSSPHSTGAAPSESAAPTQPLLKKLFVPSTASPDALAAATGQGAAALEELSTRFPEDSAVWRALMRADVKDKRGADAMRAVARLVATNERAVDDEEVWDAVTSSALTPGESSDAAFGLMETGMGSKGPDLLYELTQIKGVPPRIAARAKQSLVKADVKAKMSPALAVALDMRNTTGCEGKRALLSRVKEQGDARVLGSLRALLAPRGCGFLGLGDCWACMRRDNALGAAIAAIEERAAK
jgi:hypothetical protein